MSEELNWGLPVIGYLFLAGIGAGAVLLSAWSTLSAGRFGKSHMAIARYGAYIAPVPVIVGTSMIIFELGQPFRALNLFHLINLSPMSIGTWFIGLFTIVTILYALTFIPLVIRISGRMDSIRRALAWFCLPLGLGLALYTAIMIGAMPARPFWNSPIIALLFVLSALSGGIAAVIIPLSLFGESEDAAGQRDDRRESLSILGNTDAAFLLAELATILLFLLFAQLTIGNVQEAVKVILPGGELVLPFWGIVVGVGILLPVSLELGLMFPKLRRPGTATLHRTIELLAPAAVLTGGFALRYVVVVAGQITSPIGI